MPIEWIHDRYGEGRGATLAPGLTLYVGRHIGTQSGPPPKWYVRVFGAELRGQYDSHQPAQEAAERVAKKWLNEALAKIT